MRPSQHGTNLHAIKPPLPAGLIPVARTAATAQELIRAKPSLPRCCRTTLHHTGHLWCELRDSNPHALLTGARF